MSEAIGIRDAEASAKDCDILTQEGVGQDHVLSNTWSRVPKVALHQGSGVDTVRFSLSVDLHPEDREKLRSVAWQQGQSLSEYDVDEGREVKRREWFRHPENGARVLVDAGRVSVEASLPRWIGLGNELQGAVGDAEALGAFEAMTFDLLPATSREGGFRWYASRVDLARNFEANVPVLVGAFAQARHPAIRSNPKVFFGESVAWYGSGREIVLYDKGAEMKSKGIEGGPEPGTVARIESRWSGMKGLDKLLSSVFDAKGGRFATSEDQWRSHGCSVPIMAKTKSHWTGHTERSHIFMPFGGAVIDDVLRSDVAMFDAQKVLVFSGYKQIALDAMLHFDQYMKALFHQPKRTQARWRAELKAYRRQVELLDLVRLAWPAAA